MARKYLLCPGHIIAGDGDRHYIGERQLYSLYHVKPSECYHNDLNSLKGLKDVDHLIRLEPRADGRYPDGETMTELLDLFERNVKAGILLESDKKDFVKDLTVERIEVLIELLSENLLK